MRLNDDEVIRIYNDDYIGRHLGCPSLKKKYGYDFYDAFLRLHLPLRNDQEKNKKFYCDSNFFDVIDTEPKAYWLGFIFADGYVLKYANKKYAKFGISLAGFDSGHLEKLRDALKSNVPIHHYKTTSGYKIGTDYCRIILSDDKLANDLIKHGCVEHKSSILKPPTNVPYELRKHFILGYMDGNGSVAISNSKYGQTYKIKWVGTDDVLMWIMNHLISDGVISREYPLYKRKKEHIVSAFEFGGNRLSLKYLNYIYDGATVYLDRKHDRYLMLLQMMKEKQTGRTR